MDITTQYDAMAEEFDAKVHMYNKEADDLFHSLVSGYFREKYPPLVTEEDWARSFMSGYGELHLLDVGCGSGYDLKRWSDQGAICFGIDSSAHQVALARKRCGNAGVQVGVMESLPYSDGFFDLVVSKYAIQTSNDVPQVLREMGRVLSPGGTLVYLAVHPLRQFLEKKKEKKDYFLQEVVESVFFEGAVTAREPTHTFNEYLSPEFLSTFDLQYFTERAHFPAAEQIGGETYPCYFVVKARKR